MKLKLEVKIVSETDHDYLGTMFEYQAYGNFFEKKKYSEAVCSRLNDYQNFLYKRALFGLSIFTEEEIKNMRWDKKQRIIKVHKRTQKVLNLWKQEILNQRANSLLNKFFVTKSSEMAREVIDSPMETDEEIPCKLSFKELNLLKMDIVLKLFKEKILPPDFFKLQNI